MALCLNLQNLYLKGMGLQRYLAALTPFSELPHPLDRPFQREPEFRYLWLLKEATVAQVEAVLKGDIPRQEEYSDWMSVDSESSEGTHSTAGAAERSGFRNVGTAGRTGYRSRSDGTASTAPGLTPRALIAKRDETKLTPTRHKDSERFLAQDVEVRQEAQELVQRQEERYRYPVRTIARPRVNLTDYPFGYLYPAAELFFWRREEEQVREERFDPFFRNIWDFRRTLGLESLFFKK